MSDDYATVEHVRRLADFARASTLAQRGQVAMAREIMARYSIYDRPQIVADVSVISSCLTCGKHGHEASDHHVTEFTHQCESCDRLYVGGRPRCVCGGLVAGVDS